jgi:hypothetical protein
VKISFVILGAVAYECGHKRWHENSTTTVSRRNSFSQE